VSENQETRDGDSSHLEDRLPSAPDGYIRWTDLLKALGAIVGIFGACVGGYGFLDRHFDTLRVEIRNERVERLNAQTRIEERIDACCTVRRR